MPHEERVLPKRSGKSDLHAVAIIQAGNVF
jgi:hypothetical protein